MNNSLYIQVLDLFIRFNRKLIFSVLSVPHELSINESHVLIEVVRASMISAKEISKNIGLDKSVVSRIIDRFKSRGLVTVITSKGDKRGKELRATKLGLQFSKRDSAARNEMARRTVIPLNNNDQQELFNLLQMMGDNLNAERLAVGQSDYLGKIAIRRLTRSMGFLGESTFNTGYRIDEIQVLWILGSNAGNVSMALLKDLLPYELAALSRLVTSLSRRGFVSKDSHPADSRQVILSLSKKGQNSVGEISSKGADFMKVALRGLTNNEIKLLIRLLSEFLDNKSSLELKVARTEEERSLARKFVVRSYMARGMEDNIPEKICAKCNLVYLCLSNGDLVGVAELAKLRKSWKVIYILLDESNKDIINELRNYLNETISNLGPQKKKSKKFAVNYPVRF